jgi:hypothetical protein
MKMGITVRGNAMQRALDEKSKDVKRAQREVLADILSYARDTVYGKTHRFSSIDTPREYAREVPINEYETLRPYVNRHAAGESDVLFPGKPMFYATTSGTTSVPKLIPITRKYHDECYNGLTNLWFHSMFQEMPSFLDGRDLTMVGKTVEGRTADGTTYGSFSGHMNAYMPWFVKRVRVVPSEVHNINDYKSKYYTLMRVALEHPIRMIVAANPSNLLELHRTATTHFDEIIYDIEHGSLSSNLEVAPTIRKAVEKRLYANPRRANELRSLLHHHDPLLPRHYWPSLQVINTWKQGNAGMYLKHTQGFYPESTAIREFGYLATEARAGIVLRNNQEASILAANLIYFEFIKASEYDNPNANVYLANELEVGEEYYILITTPSGLYRYDMNDIIRVEGFFNEFPLIRFIQKGKGVTSLTGEKLHESQYLEAMETAESALGFQTSFHIAFADFESSRYHVFVEPDPATRGLTMVSIADVLDKTLSNINLEYKAKRNSNRLRSPLIHELTSNAFISYKQKALESGVREGQFKLTQLSVDDERFRLFQSIAKQTHN